MRRANEALELMIFPTRSGQGYRVRTTGRDRWTPIDVDGLTLMLRPRRVEL